MKTLERILKSLILSGLFLSSCEDYLAVEEDATSINEEEIFGSYAKFQGYVDPLYEIIIDNNKSGICVTANLAGETMGSKAWSSAYMGTYGNYWALINANSRSIFTGYENNNNGPLNEGIYEWGWRGIRIANTALKHLSTDILTDATDEQRRLLSGQAYFFRAYLHWELVRAFGSIPYVDKVLDASNYKLPRYWSYEKDGKTYHNTQAVLERVAEDLEKAAENLPWQWADDANVWETENSSTLGRVTKGAAYALQAKALLFAGSPLFNEEAGGSASYDADFCKRSADAAWKVLNADVYDLVELNPDIDQCPYRLNFATTENKMNYTKETIFIRVTNHEAQWGNGQFNSLLGRIYAVGKAFGGNAVIENPTQQYVDKFEMSDGSAYKISYDPDFEKSFNQRDPRFRKNFWVHKDEIGTISLNLSGGGKDYDANMQSPYFIHKIWPAGVDKTNKKWDKFHYSTPVLRLADVYLIYAEALFAATNDAKATAAGASLTALDAVNAVRKRALMPAATADAPAYANARPGHGEEDVAPFMRLIRNERAVELCFEGHYWYDVRRWKIGTKLDKTLYRLNFDADYSPASVTRVAVQNFTFEERHYWVPFRQSTTQYYEGWAQNPGW